MSTQTATRSLGLSPQQETSYRKDGFLWMDDVFSMEEVVALRNALEGVEEEIKSRQGHLKSTIHMLSLTTKDPVFMDLAQDPRIVSCIKPLMGPDIQLQHSKLARKPPTKGAGPFGWHQDFAFYPHTNTNLLSVMVMLDDATPENGCMSMVKGSHLLGQLNHLDKDGYFQGRCLESQYWEANPDRVVPVTPKAGGISVHHALTLHGSPANLSGRPRRGLVFSYRADDAYQLADQIFEDTGHMICGTRRGVARLEECTIRLPARRNWEPIYGSAWHQLGENVTL